MGLPTDQPAARITDIDTGHPPSSPTPIISGSSNVLTNNLPAARQGDLLVPHHPGIREISEGSSSVLINNKPAARVSDAINCGGLIVTGSADVLIGDSPSLVTADRIQRLSIQFPSEKGSKKSTKTAPQAKTSASNSSGSNSPASQSTSSPASATSSAGNAQSPSSTRSLTPAIPDDPPEEVTIWLAAPSTKEAGNWSDGYIQSILEIATEIDAETEITAAEADIAIVEYSNELPDMFQPMFKPAEDLDKTPAKVTISLIDGITPNGVKPFTEADLLEAAVTFEEMAPLIDAAINGDPLAIAELSPAVVTRKPITVEQLASLNEEQPKPVAPTPIERLNIEFPNRRKSNRRSAVEMPPLTERQSATVDEIHASLVSSGIKGVGKPEVAEYVTKREALTKQATLLENGTWYRGKAHDLADKNREVARLDYEFARRSDQVGLETSTPVLNVLGLGGVTRAATTQAVGKVAKGVAAGKSVVPNSVKPVVTAEARVNGSAFSDVNQTARVGANVDQPTLIAERIVEKSAQSGKALPNGNMGTAHAEVGAIQQAFDAGATAGADMTLTVTGKAVCGFCRGDVAAMAKQAELKSLVVYEEATGNTLYWQQGMKSLKKAK